jgi:hypothetical protein
LQPLDPRCRIVQFSRPLAPDEYPRVSSFLHDYPHVPLRIYGHEGMDIDLEFLREFPRLQQFQVNVYNLVSLDGLRHLPPTLTYLGLGQTKSKRHSLSNPESLSRSDGSVHRGPYQRASGRSGH